MQSSAGFPSPYGFGYPQAALSPSLGQITPAPLGTYPFGSLPAGQAPPILPTPGPTALGPGSMQGSLGTGVQGVGLAPIASVTPPATAGGPHQLPPLPAVPLPQGFPNPFEPATAPASGGSGAEGAAPFAPGTTTYTGPQGYLPGLGYFGRPGQGPGAALPGPYAGQSGGGAMPPGAAFPAAASPMAPQAGPYMAPQGAPQMVSQPVSPDPRTAAPSPQPGAQRQPSSPFWLALAWQMLETPAATRIMGDRLKALMDSGDRVRAIQAAANLLLTPEMQSAFRAVSSGELQQTPFTELFASRVGPALQQQGLLRVG